MKTDLNKVLFTFIFYAPKPLILLGVNLSSESDLSSLFIVSRGFSS